MIMMMMTRNDGNCRVYNVDTRSEIGVSLRPASLSIIIARLHLRSLWRHGEQSMLHLGGASQYHGYALPMSSPLNATSAPVVEVPSQGGARGVPAGTPAQILGL